MPEAITYVVQQTSSTNGRHLRCSFFFLVWSVLCCALTEGTAEGACLSLYRCPSDGLSGRLRLRLSRLQASVALGAPRSSGSGSTLSRRSPGDTAEVGSTGVRGPNAIQAQSHGLHEERGPQAVAFRPGLRRSCQQLLAGHRR